jgi:[ribosomal protein S18]-alanine N-acetyltransferase
MHDIVIMAPADLQAVLALEQSVQRFPWRRGHFEDALKNGNWGFCVWDACQHTLLGYCILMTVVDEMHVLNLCVAPAAQRTGVGRALLHQAVSVARTAKCTSLLLEVSVSNLNALQYYRRFGFKVIGTRKNYYSISEGKQENAWVMRFTWTQDDSNGRT